MAYVNATYMGGYFDTARHAPQSLTKYYRMDLEQPVCLGGMKTYSVYVNDLRDGQHIDTPGFRIVEQAIPLLRLNATHASDVLLIEPGGLDGRPHAVGGGWIPVGSGVTFYVARSRTDADADATMCNFLCADVSVRAR